MAEAYFQIDKYKIQADMIGLKIVVDRLALVRRWVFPKDRFVEYGPDDEWWARKVGFGHEVMEPGCYRVGDMILMHPDVLEAVKKVTDLVESRRAKTLAAMGGESTFNKLSASMNAFDKVFPNAFLGGW